MKLGLALALCCLAASVVFHFAPDCAGPAPAETPTAAEQPAAAPVPRSRREETVPHAPSAGDPEQFPAALSEDDLESWEDDEEPQAILRGRVASLLGELPEDASLELEQLDAREDDVGKIPVPLFDTEMPGEFEQYVVPGEYRLVARAPGFLPSALEGLRVRAGEEIGGLTLDLSPGLTLGGRVTAGDEAAPGALVVAEGQGYRLSTYAGEEGEFEIGGLLPGSYKVRAFDEWLGADEREVAAGGMVSLSLARRGRLQGQVLDPGGRAAAGARILGFERPLFLGPDRDPHGESEGVSDEWSRSECVPHPDCDELAAADDFGRFQIERTVGTQLVLTAVSGSARSELVELTDAREVTLSLRELAPAWIEVVDAGGRPVAGSLIIVSPLLPADQARLLLGSLSPGMSGRRAMMVVPGSSELAVAGHLRSDERGRASLSPWPGVKLMVRPSRDVELRGVGELPPEVIFHLDLVKLLELPPE
ncbi:MAG: carboxypeptidase regulatory-like domain-containing protein [Myxococcales bacterium]|nr:carboxypeptidase regulatory-like domain-containing protein [Myxococcales bacterium]